MLYSFSALLLGACAATPDPSSMTAAELSECLQPNRRVVVEFVGQAPAPPAKKPAAKPGEEAAKPPAKPAKPKLVAFQQSVYVQGNTAFDPGSSTLKPEGKKDIDKFLAGVEKRGVHVNAVVVSGHTDRVEATGTDAQTLSEARAKAVKDYLVSKGVSEKAIFWEGKEAREPVPVTKFCT